METAGPCRTGMPPSLAAQPEEQLEREGEEIRKANRAWGNCGAWEHFQKFWAADADFLLILSVLVNTLLLLVTGGP
ncbi:MAG: hypothetical protein ABI806_22165 [Candidatus Solibacter sp.]